MSDCSICGVQYFPPDTRCACGEPIDAMPDTHPSSDVLERVARAIFDKHNATYTMVGPARWESDPAHWLRYARAALDIPEIKSALNFHEACQKAFAVNGEFVVTEENVRGNYGVSASLPPAPAPSSEGA